MQTILLVLIFLFVHFNAIHPDRFRDQAELVLCLVAALWAWQVRNFAGRVAKTRNCNFGTLVVWLSMFYVCYSAIRVFAAKYSPFKSFGMWFDGPSAYALIWFLLLITVFTNNRIRRLTFQFFMVTASFNSFLLLTKQPGLLDNPAEDAALVACVLPFIWFSKWHWSFSVLCIIGIFCSGSATGIFALISGAVCLAIAPRIENEESRLPTYHPNRDRRFKPHWRASQRDRIVSIREIKSMLSKMVIGLIALLIGLVGFIMQREQLFSTNGRFEKWIMIWEWFKENGNWLQGMGLGTFEVLGVGIQRDHGIKSEFFLFTHNEYLQILFEIGILGLVMTIGVMIYAWIKTEDFKFRICLAILSIVALSQSPLRIPIFATWVTILILEMINGDGKDLREGD